MNTRLRPDWVRGFLEGEGCFTVSSKDGGYPRFIAVQKSPEILRMIRDQLKIGAVYPNHHPKYPCWIWQVANLDDLVVLIDFFDYKIEEPTKRKQFQKWLKAFRVYRNGSESSQRKVMNVRR